MLKNVRVQRRHIENGITENHRGYPKDKSIRVFGADTETCGGKIYTFQIASEGDQILMRTCGGSAFKQFADWISHRSNERGVNLVFFHNLRFDITVLFEPQQETIFNQYNDVYFERDGYVIRMLYGRVNFVRVWKDLGGYLCPVCKEIPAEAVKQVGRIKICGNPNHGEPQSVRRNLGTLVRWIDSAAFCPPGSKSLSAALKIYGVPHRKLVPPEGLEDRELHGKEFEAYALNDAIAVEGLGRSILDLHKEYDIPPCVSLPQLSARILRHHFFNKGESFPFPPEECRLASELSYHAGKNGLYAKRGVYEDLYEYDINSAFPKAMREMPQMVKGEYKHVQRYRPGVLGIYRIRGVRHKRSKYPLVYDSAFRPIRGSFKGLWITGYELSLLRRSTDHRFKIAEGWIWLHSKNYHYSPLGAFVERFWHLKNTTPKGPKRDTYKNILNSLYGKFAACAEKRPVVETAFGPVCLTGGPGGPEGSYFVAGSLYHPFIATQITGYVRAELYRLERRGRSLHSATDSIKSPLELETSNDLGGIKKETYGRCYLFRNKLYLHFAVDSSLCGHNLEKGWLYVSKDDAKILPRVERAYTTGICWDPDTELFKGKLFDGSQHLCKFGLHGFKGSVFHLYNNRRSLLKSGFLDYTYRHMTNLRESIKRGETPCMMVTRKERLSLDSG